MPATASTFPDRPWKRTAVRLALAFTGLTVGAFLVTTLTAYAILRVQLLEQQNQRVEEIYSLLSASADPDDETDIIDAVHTQIAAARKGRFIFQLRAASGRVLAGNVAPVALPEGWSKQPAAVFGSRKDAEYRVFVGRVNGDQLLVGVDYSELNSLRRTIQGALFGSAVLALLLAAAGSFVIVLRVQRRFALIERTMERVAQGDLSARLPLSPAGDDIDHVSAQVNAALARLAALVASMRQVSTDIAHDLRTPLNRLQLRLLEAQKQTGSGEDARPTLEAALAECAGIGATFSALLRIAQIEAGARRSRFGPVDPAAILADVADVYADVAEDAGMTLRCDPVGGAGGAPAPAIRGDVELLTQCFANLVENAIRHCPPGTVIRCAARVAAPDLAITVADDGPGIPEAERERVFRRLYRLERSRTTPGSGLGLSLVKAVAELHEATVTLSDAGPGLAVTLHFRATDALPARPRSGGPTPEDPPS